MSDKLFTSTMVFIALLFTLIFAMVVMPALLIDKDIIGGLLAGFVNPYSSGYSADVILCWCTLAMWIIHDAKQYAIKYGWVCLLLGAVPGVAVGFPLYLILRNKQLNQTPANAAA